MTRIVIYALAALTLSLSLGGCTRAAFVKPPADANLTSDITIVVPKSEPWIEIRNGTYIGGKGIMTRLPLHLAETYYAAADYGKRHGHRYFAVRNATTDNLAGFPINTFEGMLFYCGLAGRGHFRSTCWHYDRKESIMRAGHATLKVLYFDDPLPGYFLYDIDRTLAETRARMGR